MPAVAGQCIQARVANPSSVETEAACPLQAESEKQLVGFSHTRVDLLIKLHFSQRLRAPCPPLSRRS